MKITCNIEDATNWTAGKEYDAAPSFIEGYVSVTDDLGAEQIIRTGSALFTWKNGHGNER